MGRYLRVSLLLLMCVAAVWRASPAGSDAAPTPPASPHEGEARLRDALASLQATAASGGWHVVAAGPALRPGSHGPRVLQLRRRLGETDIGDRFGERLTAAVKRFQQLHGLEPDGVAGARTLAALNVPIEQRIAQVEANLQRWQEVPPDLGDPHVRVNIPAFELSLVRDGQIVWRTRIVAGKAWSPTPVLSDRIVAVVANPSWNVPSRIAVEDYLPELRRDPRALARHGLRLFERAEGSEETGREVDPSTVKWRRIDEEHFPYLLRQDPGPQNSLGRLKFVLTNTMAIYLHDTPAKHLFGVADRDLSHGCIRVEKPVELAEALMDDPAPLREALEGTDERRLPVRPPVPVHILYMTVWVDDEGGLNFRDDVYGLDAPRKDAGSAPGAASPVASGTGGL